TVLSFTSTRSLQMRGPSARCASLGMSRRRLELGSALCLKLFQHPADNRQCGSRLLCRENERWMDPDSWGVTHHDQAFGETAFEELNAFLLLEQRFGLLIGHEIESDQ